MINDIKIQVLHLKSAKAIDKNKLGSGTMGFLNPCPCMLLETGVKIIAILQMVGGIINLAIYGLSYGDVEKSNLHDEVKQLGKTILISNMVVIGFTTLVSFGLCIGAVKRSTRLCWVWIVMTIIGICFAIIITVSTTGMMAQDQDNASSSRNTVILCITIAIQLYFLWVVFAFIQQVKQVGQGETNNNVELGGQPGEGAQPMYVPYAYQPQYPSQQASIAQSNNQ